MKCPNCKKEIFKAYLRGKLIVCQGYIGYNENYSNTCYDGLPIAHTCMKEKDD